MRYRQDSPEELARARTAVAQWRDQNPEGTPAELGDQFAPDYGPVLRGMLFAADRRRAAPGNI